MEYYYSVPEHPTISFRHSTFNPLPIIKTCWTVIKQFMSNLKYSSK